MRNLYCVLDHSLTSLSIERCLSYDDKPLLILEKLKEAKKNPMFMLKHVKDIRSPISAAKEKQAALIGSSSLSQRSNRDTFMRSVPKSPLRVTTQPNRPNRTNVIRESHLAVEDIHPGLSLFFSKECKKHF